MAEFGDPQAIIAAFVAASPARRAARTLLRAGPIVGWAWAGALITWHAWHWSVPAWAYAGCGAALLGAVALLALAPSR